MTPELRPRPFEAVVRDRLEAEGLHPLMARVSAARGITQGRELATGLDTLLPFDQLYQADAAACVLADAIAAGHRITVVADYDSDGATACALAVRVLRLFGARVAYTVPNRFEYGYGLTPEIVALVAADRPDLILTVDNGISSEAGVEAARALGIEVLITDHHLPGATLPAARVIVNPNQPGCGFPSKSMAGVGVIFYTLLALRAELRRRGIFADGHGPNLAQFLDLVALGTVADVVRLDQNNRALVAQGLQRIRSGRCTPGIAALFKAAGRDPARASSYDLGYCVAPRLNAAGRLDDMALGIECLLSDDPASAFDMARRLDELNRERREIENDMQASADQVLEQMAPAESHTLCLYDANWHQGVIGILASRLKDRFHRPTIVFAPAGDGRLRGSGRSIHGLQLRDALERVATGHPGLIEKFGGHAMAAGVTLKAEHFAAFAAAFEATAQQLLTPAQLEAVIETDGPVHGQQIERPLAETLGQYVWGQGFPEPLFQADARVCEQRIVGERHCKLRLDIDGCRFDAMLFFQASPLPETIHAAFHIQINEYQGQRTVQLTLRHWLPAGG